MHSQPRALVSRGLWPACAGLRRLHQLLWARQQGSNTNGEGESGVPSACEAELASAKVEIEALKQKLETLEESLEEALAGRDPFQVEALEEGVTEVVAQEVEKLIGDEDEPTPHSGATGDTGGADEVEVLKETIEKLRAETEVDRRR